MTMRRCRTIWSLVLAALLSVACARAAEDYVWWEGENFTDSNFPASTEFNPVDARGA